MKSFARILALCLVIVLAVAGVFTLSACNKDPDPVPTPTPDPTPDPDPAPEPEDEVLELISEGVVNFTVVRTGDLKSGGVKKAQNLVKDLEKLGLNTTLVADSDAEAVTECEVIIGSGAKNREGCNIDYHTLGKDGYVIKVIGKRVVIAGGTDDALCEAVDVFREKVLGLTEDTETLAGATITMKATDVYERGSEYDLVDIKVGAKGSLKRGYYISTNSDKSDVSEAITQLRLAIYNESGIWLPLESDLPAGESAEHFVRVNEVADAGEGGFRAYVDDDDNLIIECSFLFHIERGIDAFLNKYVYGKTGVSRIYADEPFDHAINVVRYTEFGAVGDGKTDDFLAMYATHQYANAYGIKVLEDQGLTYYIGESSYGRAITVHTDVNLGKAKFIIDDRKLKPDAAQGNNRKLCIFDISPSAECKMFLVDESLYENISLERGDTNIGITFDGPMMLQIYYCEKNIYIRYGANANDGSDTNEAIIVDKDGNIDPSTPLTFDYPKLDLIRAYSLDEEPLTFEGGIFTTYANQLSYEFTTPGYRTGDQYYSYARNINVTRSNTTVKGVEHYIEHEGDGGYPYDGFFTVQKCVNVLFTDCVVTGHRAYVEDRDLNGDGIIQQNEIDKGTTMGSYDLIVGTAINATFRNIRQSNSITNNFYWGLMGSNFGRNIVYDGCYLSRFDAHCGVYNAKVMNSTIGFAINLTGDGDFYLENVTKLVGSNLIDLRSDYGSTWNGRIFIKDVRMEG